MVLGQPKKTHPKRSKDRVHQMGQTQIYHGHAHAHGLPNDTEYQQVHRLEGGGSRVASKCPILWNLVTEKPPGG